MNETNLLIDHSGEAAQAAAERLDRVATNIRYSWNKHEAIEVLNDHFFDHGDNSPILKCLAAFATGGKQTRDDAIVYLKVAVDRVMDAQALIAAQKMIDDGMVGFQEDDL